MFDAIVKYELGFPVVWTSDEEEVQISKVVLQFLGAFRIYTNSELKDMVTFKVCSPFIGSDGTLRALAIDYYNNFTLFKRNQKCLTNHPVLSKFSNVLNNFLEEEMYGGFARQYFYGFADFAVAPNSMKFLFGWNMSSAFNLFFWDAAKNPGKDPSMLPTRHNQYYFKQNKPSVLPPCNAILNMIHDSEIDSNRFWIIAYSRKGAGAYGEVPDLRLLEITIQDNGQYTCEDYTLPNDFGLRVGDSIGMQTGQFGTLQYNIPQLIYARNTEIIISHVHVESEKNFHKRHTRVTSMSIWNLNREKKKLEKSQSDLYVPNYDKKLQGDGLYIYSISRVAYTGEFFIGHSDRGVWLKACMPRPDCEMKWTLFHHNAWTHTVPSDAENFHPFCEGPPVEILENGIGIVLETSIWGDSHEKCKTFPMWMDLNLAKDGGYFLSNEQGVYDRGERAKKRQKVA